MDTSWFNDHTKFFILCQIFSSNEFEKEKQQDVQMLRICPSCCFSFSKNSTYLAFHTCTVLSPPPEAMYLPFGDHATACTSRLLETVFFVYVKICSPVRPFQSWTLLAAEAMVLLSGDHATACTEAVSPR